MIRLVLILLIASSLLLQGCGTASKNVLKTEPSHLYLFTNHCGVTLTGVYAKIDSEYTSITGTEGLAYYKKDLVLGQFYDVEVYTSSSNMIGTTNIQTNTNTNLVSIHYSF